MFMVVVFLLLGFLLIPTSAFAWGPLARRKVQEYYSLDAVARKYSELYGRLMNTKASSH